MSSTALPNPCSSESNGRFGCECTGIEQAPSPSSLALCPHTQLGRLQCLRGQAGSLLVLFHLQAQPLLSCVMSCDSSFQIRRCDSWRLHLPVCAAPHCPEQPGCKRGGCLHPLVLPELVWVWHMISVPWGCSLSLDPLHPQLLPGAFAPSHAPVSEVVPYPAQPLGREPEAVLLDSVLSCRLKARRTCFLPFSFRLCWS